MGFLILLALVALLPMNDVAGQDPCTVVRPGDCVPKSEWRNEIIPCVNHAEILQALTPIFFALPQTMAELGFGEVLTDIDELNGAGNIRFKGPTSIPSGGVAAPHWTRPGLVFKLIYTVIVGGEEIRFAFTSSQFDSLTPGDTLQGAILSLQAGMGTFPMYHPGTVAEALPSLAQDFAALLASFEAGGSRETLTLADGGMELGDSWSIVVRPTIEYKPTLGTNKIHILRYCGFRIALCFNFD
ncbi:Hypp3072 [Branchiostoma lanceolatum]|uniref:Hypp3072 protein n=1 Tax=Branchiostoma lanceolatum TaxID=7740 RepID=A0A8J9ZYZ9_BRALA|nr:Hypp3072 [Branchiostoma lanceolatum]